MTELKQKHLGSYKHYKIGKDRVFIETKNINKYEEFFVKFENLGLDLTRKKTKSILILIPIYFAITLLQLYVFVDEYQKGDTFPHLLIYIFGIILFGVGTVYSFFQKTDKIYIKGGMNELDLYAENPDKESVTNFIEKLQIAIKDNYKKKYGRIDSNLDEENQIFNFKWLLEMEIISETEFEELVNNLKIKNLLK